MYGKVSYRNQCTTDPTQSSSSPTNTTAAPEKQTEASKGGITSVGAGVFAEHCVQRPVQIPISKISDPFAGTESDDDDWIDSLHPLPMYEQPRGCFRLGDVLSIMPLSLFCKALFINSEVRHENKTIRKIINRTLDNNHNGIHSTATVTCTREFQCFYPRTKRT